LPEIIARSSWALPIRIFAFIACFILFALIMLIFFGVFFGR
jgi:hypothetical protein